MPPERHQLCLKKSPQPGIHCVCHPPPIQPQKYRVRHLHFRVDVAQHAVQAHDVVDDIIKLEKRNIHLGTAHLKTGSCSPACRSTISPNPLV